MLKSTANILCVWLCLTAASAAELSWPTFHGLKRDNLSTEKGLLKSWPLAGPKLVWQNNQCGMGYATISATPNALFTTGDFGDVEMVLAFDLNGKPLWKTPNGKAWKGATPGARTNPACDDGMVYHLGPHGSLSALDAASGKVVWQMNVREKFEAQLGMWGYTENLVVDGNKVLCMPGGASGKVVALDKKTGTTLWANTAIPDRAGYSSPIIAVHQGVRQYILLARSTVFGVEVESGKLLWLHEHKGFCDQNVTSPIYHAGSVFVSSGHKAGARVVKLGLNDQTAREVWFNTRLDNCHGGVVLLDGYLYGSGCRLHNKGLLCVNFETGQVQYQAEELGKFSLTYAEGLLYCLDNDGEMMLAKATPQKAQIISRFKLPRTEEATHTLAHPVICDGRLYLRHLTELFCYDIREKARP